MAIPRKELSQKCSSCHGQGTIRSVNGRWLAWLRLKGGLTLRDVAARAKVSHTTIVDVERNRQRPSRSVRGVYAALERRLKGEGAIK